MLNAAMQFPARKTQFFFSVFVKTKKKIVSYRQSSVAFAIIENNIMQFFLPLLAKEWRRGCMQKSHDYQLVLTKTTRGFTEYK